MEIEQLNLDDRVYQNEKLKKCALNLKEILEALRNRDIPKDTVIQINQEINELNTFSGDDKGVKKKIKSAKSTILKQIEKKLKLVPKNHYRNQWMAIGMSSFGLPMGVVFGIVLDNMAFLGIGLPIGMAIGMAIGSSMDENARKEGRQLDVDLEF